jgi:hypothetical protein
VISHKDLSGVGELAGILSICAPAEVEASNESRTSFEIFMAIPPRIEGG